MGRAVPILAACFCCSFSRLAAPSLVRLRELLPLPPFRFFVVVLFLLGVGFFYGGEGHGVLEFLEVGCDEVGVFGCFG